MEDSNNRQLFTVTIFSEHCVGLLNQVSIIFTRRCLNIEDVTASRTSIDGVHRLTITVWSDRETMVKVVNQIEKRIDVLRAFLYSDDDIVYQEVALYKVDTSKVLQEQNLEGLIRHHNARILEINPNFTVIEKTGQPWETEALLHDMRPYGVKQFVRSGRVCVSRDPVEQLDQYLEEQKIRQGRILGKES